MHKALVIIFVCLLLNLGVYPQTTEFAYQGNLKDGTTPANGNYDFEFALFDSLNGGAQQGPTLTRSTVAVASGTFSVKLDFGAQFPGAGRFLEIHVRPAGNGSFTVLAPRQQISNAPYAVRSLNAATADTATNAANATNATTANNALNLGGVAANQYVVTTDSRMTDSRAPTAGSANYIQNQNAAPQSSSNFNISGNGSVGGTLSGNVVSAATQFEIDGARILFGNLANNNLFVGIGAGVSNTTGDQNTFVGRGTGPGNLTGNNNAFFGAAAGNQNTGSNNTAVGRFAGLSNTTGSNNTLVGANSNVSSPTLTYAAAFGADAVVGTNNTIVMGRSGGQDSVQIPGSVGIGTAPVSPLHINGNSSDFAITLTNQANSPGLRGYRLAFDNNRLSFQRANDSGGLLSTQMVIDPSIGNVGIGTTTPNSFYKLQVEGNAFVNGTLVTGDLHPLAIVAGGSATIGGSLTINNNGAINVGGSVSPLITLGPINAVFNGNVGIGTGSTIMDRLHLSGGFFRLDLLGSAGSTTLCRNASNQISTCSSSLRYKTNIAQFSSGLAFIKQLHPITFNWKQGGMKDVGFGAEDVAKIDPLFVTYNARGEAEGVKYDRLSAVFVNAFKEQQEQIDRQQKEIEDLRNIVSQLQARHSVRKTSRRSRK